MTQFFGLFALSGKATSFMAPLLIGTIAALWGLSHALVAEQEAKTQARIAGEEKAKLSPQPIRRATSSTRSVEFASSS